MLDGEPTHPLFLSVERLTTTKGHQHSSFSQDSGLNFSLPHFHFISANIATTDKIFSVKELSRKIVGISVARLLLSDL